MYYGGRRCCLGVVSGDRFSACSYLDVLCLLNYIIWVNVHIFHPLHSIPNHLNWSSSSQFEEECPSLHHSHFFFSIPIIESLLPLFFFSFKFPFLSPCHPLIFIHFIPLTLTKHNIISHYHCSDSWQKKDKIRCLCNQTLNFKYLFS